jgi:DNA-binding MarR family transcriptional regulator
MFQELDPLLHSPLRLAVMSYMVAKERAEFNDLKEATNATSGNLSVQITKLETAGYITVEKGYKGKRPLTTCLITRTGKHAFDQYVQSIQSYIKPS